MGDGWPRPALFIRGCRENLDAAAGRNRTMVIERMRGDALASEKRYLNSRQAQGEKTGGGQTASSVRSSKRGSKVYVCDDHWPMPFGSCPLRTIGCRHFALSEKFSLLFPNISQNFAPLIPVPAQTCGREMGPK